MANIYCANKMGKWLGSVKPLPENPPVENTWNANIFKVERKNWLICVHNPTAYSLFFPEIKKVDTHTFDLWFYPRLSEQFLYDGIKPELAALFPSSSIQFFKTNNHKRTIGLMNQEITELKYSLSCWGGVSSISLSKANHRFNIRPIGPNPYTFPIEAMGDFLRKQT